MKYFSMFSGVGGFELGIQKAIPNAECVGFSEIDKYSNIVLAYRFKEVKNYGDATKINTDELPEFDLLCGGFPCQAFSIAGKRRGFEDTRGTMFFEITRIFKAKRPRTCVFENVKGLLNHDKGKTFRVIIQSLEELGYDVEWMVLNSKFFGVPQNRERVFIIGSLRGERKLKILPFGQDAKKVQELLRRKVYQYHRKGDIRVFKGFSPTLTSSQSTDRPVVFSHYPRTGNPKIGGSGTLASQEHCFTIDRILHIATSPLRRFTPRECERLQGFPDDWTLVSLPNGKMMSDSQRYKQMGNAVTVNVIEYLIKEIFKNETKQ